MFRFQPSLPLAKHHTTTQVKAFSKYYKNVLLVFISVLKVEFLDDNLDVSPGDGGDQLLESHQAVVVLVQQGERLPAIALHQGFVSLGLE